MIFTSQDDIIAWRQTKCKHFVALDELPSRLFTKSFMKNKKTSLHGKARMLLLEHNI